MDCAQDLEFHMPNDSGRALEKAKESILLIKKKMLRSHDLILQYNNKLKECERLKEDLSLAREEATKFKRENSLNLTKVVKLEMQSTEHKKIRQELEQKIAEKDIQIASDKSHLQQLECKLNAVEEKHAEKDMEAELTRSSLEVKTKELEQELKALKKSHTIEVNKLEKALKSPKEKKGKKIIEVVKETREIGMNTVEEVLQPKPRKPTTANKMILTNEFYHIRNDPYPIFCNKCESVVKPNVEKICQIMAHPPPVSNIVSPIRACVPESQKPDTQCLTVISKDLHRNESTRPEMNLSDTRRVESNYNETNRVDQFPRNFDSPLPSQLPVSNASHEFPSTSVDVPVPELDNLRRKIETLERKIKKQKTQKSSDSHPANANCCSHQHPMNYCGHSSTHVNPVTNAQADLMTEFFNKIMTVVNQRDLHQETTKVSTLKKDRTLRDKRLRNKLRKLKKSRMLKKRSSQNWEVESDECDTAKSAEKDFDASDPTKPHLLRIKPSGVSESPVTLFSDTESEKLSREAPFPKNSSENAEKSSEPVNRTEGDCNWKSVAKIPDNRNVTTRGRKRGRASLFSDDGESEIETEFVKNEIIEETQKTDSKNSARNTRTRSKSLRDDENQTKTLSAKEVALQQQNDAISSLHSTIKESDSLLSERDATDPESCISSRNYELNESPLNFEGIDDCARMFSKSPVVTSDADHGDVSPEIHYNSEPLECTNLRDRVEMQKRRRSKSPKTPKCTGRSNLLGKLRALKKSSVSMVSRTSNAPTIHTTRSLSRRKLTEQSDNDDFEGATKEGKRPSSNSEDETSVPMKKQRIAHVPKKAASVQSDEHESPVNSKKTEILEASDELCKNTDEKSTNDDTTAAIKRPVTRRSAVEKSAQNNSNNAQESIKTGKVGRPRLPAGSTTTGRRGRPPGKRNGTSNAQMSSDLTSKELAPTESKAESTESQVNGVNGNDKPVLLEKRDIDPKDFTKDSENSPQKIEGYANDEQVVGFPEKGQISELAAVETVKFAEDSIEQSKIKEGSSTESIHATDDSLTKTAAARALQVDKPSAAPSIASLDGVLVKPAEISILPNRSAVSVIATAIENKDSKENLPCEKSSVSINAMDVLSAGLSNTNSTTSDTHDDIAQNVNTLEESKDLLNGQPENKIISSVPDESPASPSSVENSSTEDIEMSTAQPMKPEDRLSIYDNVALSIPLKETAKSISMNFDDARVENATASNKFTPRDTSSDMPMEMPIERKLVVYDTNLHDNLDGECEEFDSKNTDKSQFFLEASAVTKKKARSHSGSSVESINVVKELRSRQVLCSPSKSANQQNLQKNQKTSNDEIHADFPRETRGSRSDSYGGVRSLGTLLNRHLAEQKKKSGAKNSKLRRAATNKLQEAAEKNVKMELEKLVESEEWTSELHRSVLARLTDIRSERTVAKSIVDFLLERASLDEPLDRTYTPPAPVMTRTQQRIVTLMNYLNRVETMGRIFDIVQAGIEYNVFKLGHVQPVETVEYLFRILAVIARLRKDRERVRILCCDALYFLGRRAIPAIHVILTVWPEVLPKHGTIGSELPNCLAHIIKQEQIGKDPFPKILALKKMITNYYEYPQTQAVSAVVMTVLMKALHEKYSSDLEVAILLISKREGNQWALNNIIEKGLMKIIQDDKYQWQFEIVNLLGFVLRSFSTFDMDTSVKKFVDLLCQMLDSGKGSQDKQEGIVAALLSLSRYKNQFGRISDSVLKWTPNRELRTTTSKQLESFFKSHAPDWWNARLQYKMKKNAAASDKSN